MTHSLFALIVVVALLIAAWFVVERFSPDPLVTKLCQIGIFLVALYVVIMKLLPMAGIG